MKNVQISFDEDLLTAVDSIAASSQLSRSAIVREALKKWIQEAMIKEFEKKWIHSLRKDREQPTEDMTETDAWFNLEHWGD